MPRDSGAVDAHVDADRAGPVFRSKTSSPAGEARTLAPLSPLIRTMVRASASVHRGP